MTTWVVLNNGSLQIERELKIRLYGRESFCDRKALNRHAVSAAVCPGLGALICAHHPLSILRSLTAREAGNTMYSSAQSARGGGG
jgi:hypothetical protein